MATLLGLGVIVLLVAWLPLALKTIPLSLALAGWTSLLGSGHPASERLWAVTGLVVLVSIVVPGIGATPAMRWLDRTRS